MTFLYYIYSLSAIFNSYSLSNITVILSIEIILVYSLLKSYNKYRIFKNPIYISATNINIKLSNEYFLPIYSQYSPLNTCTIGQDAESGFESFFYNNPIGMLRITDGGKILLFNNSIYNLLDFKSKEVLIEFNFLDNDYREEGSFIELKQKIKKRESFVHEEKWQRPNGGYLYVREYYRYVWDKLCNKYYYEVTIEDISKIKKIERVLEITEEKFKIIIDQVPVGIYRVIATGEVLFANLRLAELLGYESPEELTGKPAKDFLSNPSDYNLFKKDILNKETQSFIREYKLRKKDGTEIWVQDTGKIFYDTSNEVLFFDGIIEEITARKSAEEELYRLITAINQISEGIIVTDDEGIIIYANHAFEKVTGYTIHDVLSKNILTIQEHINMKEYFSKVWKTIQLGKDWQGTLNNKRKNGEIYNERLVITPVKDYQNNIINFIVIKRDITEESRMEQQLRHSQKLQAIGTLAGGIAHDFNNILMGMQIFTEILLKKISKDTQEYNLLQKVYSSQNRAKDLIKQILSFSRQSGDEKEALSVHILIKEAIKLIKSTFPSTLKIHQNIADCGKILANPTQIHQIIMNLCTNANHAMEGQGTLTVELSRSDYIIHADGTKEGTENQWVLLKVKDTGCGIEEKIKDRVYDPFFTTKSVGQGTGLGLSTVHGIVKQYGGEIYFTSEIGKGTIFYIYLPAL